jgi:hypothetical protein
MRRRGRTHRRTNGVDGDVDDFRHGGVGSDSGAVRKDGGSEWTRRGGAFGLWLRTALSGWLLSRPARSDTTAHGSQSGRGTERHCRRQAGPTRTTAADRWDPLISVF